MKLINLNDHHAYLNRDSYLPEVVFLWIRNKRFWYKWWTIGSGADTGSFAVAPQLHWESRHIILCWQWNWPKTFETAAPRATLRLSMQSTFKGIGVNLQNILGPTERDARFSFMVSPVFEGEKNEMVDWRTDCCFLVSSDFFPLLQNLISFARQDFKYAELLGWDFSAWEKKGWPARRNDIVD